MSNSQKRPAHLGNLSVRRRERVLRNVLSVVADPVENRRNPVEWGQCLQIIYDMFSVYGWAGTGGQQTIKHNLGKHSLDQLKASYEEWLELQQTEQGWRQ